MVLQGFFSVAIALITTLSTAEFVAGVDTKTAKRSVIALNVTVIVVSLINTLLLVWQNAFSYKDRAAVYLKARKDFDNAFHTLLKERRAPTPINCQSLRARASASVRATSA